MMGMIGHGLLLMAMAFASAGAVTGWLAGARRSMSAWRTTRWLAYGFCFAMIAAVLLMEYALITHDFSVKYVAQVGSKATPLHITIVSLWSSLEGSILFWGGVLAIYLGIFVRVSAGRHLDIAPYATAVSLVVGAFFSLAMAVPANPFVPAPIPVPTDGPGPNPLLQNHLLMIVHPPMLYLGFVGMTIPFALAVAGLMRGGLGPNLLATLRVWLLIPWTFLTGGIVLGGWWAYEVLGWGGYWAWDPVENASFMPWLTATAALHAAMLPHRREALKGWTITLVLSTFLLTLLGTFMTRSGVFNSVHAFSQSDIGPMFLVFLAICFVGCVFLLATRVDRLEGEGAIYTVASRESAFLVNNLLFVAFTFTVLIGTTFPLITEAIRGTKLSVGEPYFNQMAVPMGLAILFLMGVGPALPWGRASFDQVQRQLGAPLGVGLIATGIAFALGMREGLPLLTVGCAGFATVVSIREIVPNLRTGRNFRKVGAHVIHLGIVIIIVGIAMSSAFRVDREIVVKKGESVEFEGYSLSFTDNRRDKDPHRTREIAVITVKQGDKSWIMEPALTQYPGSMSPIGTPEVRSSLTHDLYLSLMNLDTDAGTVGLHVYHNPMVIWIWIGTALSMLGVGVLFVPSRRAVVVPAGAVVAGK